MSIPQLSLKSFHENESRFVQELGEAFETYGFVGITDHGIPDQTIKNTYTAMRSFFSLDNAIKEHYHIPGLGGARGYTGFGVERAKDSTLFDLKEFWHMGRDLPPNHPYEQYMPANIWPKECSEFEHHLKAIFQALDHLGNTILEAIALHLSMPKNFFKDKVNFGNSVLRPLHYPPIQDEKTPHVRAGAHEDINLITLLVGSEEPGLEILSKQNEWIPVTSIKGTIVCNVGDMLERMTNNLLKSTTHRVVNPPGPQRRESRYSVPFFLHLNPDYVIESIPTCVTENHPNQYPPIMTNDFLLQRLREINLLQ